MLADVEDSVVDDNQLTSFHLEDELNSTLTIKDDSQDTTPDTTPTMRNSVS
jgi:hypothetical protein